MACKVLLYGALKLIVQKIALATCIFRSLSPEFDCAFCSLSHMFVARSKTFV